MDKIKMQCPNEICGADVGQICYCKSESALNGLLCGADIKYLISRLKQVKDHMDDGNYHMASAKLLADISALGSIADT